MRSRDMTFIVLVLILTGIAVSINFAPADARGTQRWFGRDVSTRLGLDLQGGTQVLLRADTPDVTAEQMQTAAGVIERRVNGLGVSESVIQRSGADRIIVELPGVTNPEQAVSTIRSAGRLEFIAGENGQGFDFQTAPPQGSTVRTSGNPTPRVQNASTNVLSGTSTLSGTGAVSATQTLNTGPIYQSITDGRDLDTGAVQPRVGGTQNLSNPYAVAFSFRGESASRLANFTTSNVQRLMCIVLDNVVYSCPQIQSPLVNGSGEITTSTREDMEQIFSQLKYGALPVSLVVESSRTVSASLGQDSVDASLLAGIVGLAVVGLFMILYYRLPGVLATIALLIYTALSFAIYKTIPVTLTLAGIAGFIISLGMAVDANVLIFARLKEELRRGRTMRFALDAAFKEAWPAIRDSSVATLITSVILFMFGNSFGVSIIKGFALTLGLGTVLSLFTAVVVTNTLLRLIASLRFAQNPWMFELDRAPGLDQGRSSGPITEA
ncbi:MAG TPA: protein translocase subunit SecD [Roseiflexaceae bacterium]|nr:protein translocase subunit SecD [Roseiflexaceae bacterium]